MIGLPICKKCVVSKNHHAGPVKRNAFLTRTRRAAVNVWGYVAEFNGLPRIRKQRKQLVGMSEEAGQVTTFINFVENQPAVSSREGVDDGKLPAPLTRPSL